MEAISKTNNKDGVTIITLIIMITILLILAGIILYNGKDILKKAELEELKTNLLLIEAKAREHVEEANFKIGIGTQEEKAAKVESVRKEIYEDTEKLKKATTEEIPENFHIPESQINACYYLTKETKEKWGLEKLKNEEQYLIQFDEENVTVEVYNKEGYNGKYYKLSDIEQIQE